MGQSAHDTATSTCSKGRRLGQQLLYAFCSCQTAARAAITAFYAFCREVDDVVDDDLRKSRASPAPSWPGGRPRWRRPMRAAQPPGDEGELMPPHCRLASGQPPAGRDRGLPRWTWSRPAISTSRACGATATGGGMVGRWQPHLRTDRHIPPHTRPQTGAGVPARKHHPRRGRDAMRAISYLDPSPGSNLTSRRTSSPGASIRTRQFTALMRSRPARPWLYDEALALLPTPTAARKARPDGEHLPHLAAARDRMTLGTAAHQPHAAAQVLAGVEVRALGQV